MNKQDKIIIIFYIFIAVSYPSFLIYADYSFKNEITIIDLWPKIEETHNFDHTKIVNVNKKTIFNVLTDVEGYTKVLPNNVLSVKIINKTNNLIYAEEKVGMYKIGLTVQVKHTLKPYDEHIVEILDGDARGTIIIQTFNEINNTATEINTLIKPNFHIILVPLNHLPLSEKIHLVDVVINKFEDYLSSNSKME